MCMCKKYIFLFFSLLCLIIVCLAQNLDAQISLLLFFVSLSLAICVNIFAKNILVYVFIVLFSFSFSLTLIEGYYYFALNENRNSFQHDWNHKPVASKKTSNQEKPAPVVAQTEKKDLRSNPQKASTQDHSVYIKVKRELENGKVLYDVVYTFNSQHYRITPAHEHAKKAVIFLGCSFTFGDGLEDHETFPWRVSEKLGKDYQVFNYGLSGNGTHHALNALQVNMEKFAAYDDIIVFYTAIDDHLRRFRHGPRYEIKDGLAVRNGDYAPISYFWNKPALEPWFKKSFLFYKIAEPLKDYLDPLFDKEKRVDFMQTLVTTMQNNLQKKYPKSRFVVLAWPPRTFELLEALPKNISLYNVEDWLPSFAAEEFKSGSKYVIYPGVDAHPTAYANELVSDALAKMIREQMER